MTTSEVGADRFAGSQVLDARFKSAGEPGASDTHIGLPQPLGGLTVRHLSSRGSSLLRLRLSRSLLLGLAMFGLVALSACGGDDDDDATAAAPNTEEEAGDAGGDAAWADVIAAAEQEGSVVMYGAKGPPIPDRIMEGFRAAYPEIDIEYIDLGSGDQVERVDQELAAGKLGADFLLNSEVLWQADLVERGVVVGPESFGPSTELWDEEYYKDGLVQLNADPIGIMYNTDLVDEVPTNWDTLVDEKYKGRIGVLDASIATTPVLYWDMIRETMGQEFIDELGELEPQIHGGTTSMAQAVAAGELAWSTFANAYTTLPLQDEGAPVEIAFPEKTIMVQMNGVILKDAPHPNAALVLMDWLMSEEGQMAIDGDGLGYSRIGVEGSLQFDADRLTGITAKYADPAVVDEINKIFDEAFRQ